MKHIFPGPLPYAGDSEPDKDVDGTDAARFANNYGKTGEGLFGDFDEDGDVDDDDLAVFGANFGIIDWDAYTVSATATDDDGTYSSNTLEVIDPPVSEEVFGQSGVVNSSVTSIQPVVSQELSSKKVGSVGETPFAARAEQRGSSSRVGEESLLLRAAAFKASCWQGTKLSSSYPSWKSGLFSERRFRVFTTRPWSLSEWRQDDGDEDETSEPFQILRATDPQRSEIGGRRSGFTRH